jgi:hypothetical protein
VPARWGPRPVGERGETAAWFFRRRRRTTLALLALSIPVALVAQQSVLVSDALGSPSAVYRQELAVSAAQDASQEIAAAAYWTRLPVWLDGLEPGGEAWLTPVPSDEWIVWRGTRFRAGTATGDPHPVGGNSLYVVTAGATRLLVLVEPVDPTHWDSYDLIELRTDAPPRLLAEKVFSAVAAPDGVGYAYATWEQVVLHPAAGPPSQLWLRNHALLAGPCRHIGLPLPAVPGQHPPVSTGPAAR